MSGGGSSGSSQSQGSGSSYTQSASESIPVNLQNPAFTNMSGQTATDLESLSNMLFGGGGNALLQSFIGPLGGFSAPVTSQQNQTLADLSGAQTGNFGYNPTAQAEEQQLVSELNPNAFGQQTASSLMSSLPSGFLAQLAASGNPNAVGSNAEGAALAGLPAGFQAMMAPNYAASLATGPTTNSVIQDALAPIRAQFQGSTAPGLASSFMGAGQRVGGPSGVGSSAFDMAFGNAQGSELATEAATSGNIVNSVYGQGLTLGGAANTAAAQIGANAFDLGYGGAVNTAATGANLAASGFGMGFNTGANAPAQLNTLTQTQISDLLQSLQGEALPQLTQQLGINNALSTYNTSVNSLLQALGLQVQGEQPVIGNVQESATNSASFQNEESSGQQSSFNFGLGNLI